MKKVFMSLAAGLLLTIAQQASAAITYVDATSGAGGNTTIFDSGTSSYVDFNPNTLNNGTDGIWRSRSNTDLTAPFGIGNTIFESGGSTTVGDSNSENTAILRTTISGLTAGETYSVFVYTWNAGYANPQVGNITAPQTSANHNWRLFAGFTDTGMTFYQTNAGIEVPSGTTNATQVLTADIANFTSPVIINSGDRRLFQISLGQAIATGAGTIDVFIDDDNLTEANSRRTWYDGVGYQVSAIPEPTSVAMIGLGCAGYLARRRMKKTQA